jgi:hypothetical protein
MKLSYNKKSEWEYFIKRLGISNIYEKFVEKEKQNFLSVIFNDSEREATKYVEENPPIEKVLPTINEVLTEEPENIKLINWLFLEYSFINYSIDRSKEIILNSIADLSKDYGSNIPLVYTTLKLPASRYYNVEVWRELCNPGAFRKKDYGNLDFINAILELRNDKIISTHFFNIISVSQEQITFKLIINLRKQSILKKKIRSGGSQERNRELKSTFSRLAWIRGWCLEIER